MYEINETQKTMRLNMLPTFIFATAAVLALVFAFSGAGKAYASGAALYENPNTGEIFLKPGPGRVKVGQSVINQLLKPNAKKTTEQIKNLKTTEKKLEVSLKTVKSQTLPAWIKHVSLGALIYMGYGYYTQTGLTEGSLQLQENPPASGNNGYNAFNVNRAYLIFLYHQDNWFLKVTPNINKSDNSAYSGGSTGGNEYFRLKYAFLQFNHVYDANGLTVNLKAGQFPTPMVAWEDGLLGYHVAERTPWGFLNVTSTQVGLGVSGKYRSNGRVYLAYNAGFFDNAAFHANETVDQKSPQARLTIYPLGADSGLNGLSISGYYAWAEDNSSFGDAAIGPNTNSPETRVSAVLDYKTPNANIALQYDYAINHIVEPGAGESGDSDSYCGIESDVYGCYTSSTMPLITSLYSGHNVEHGYDAFGYYNIPNTRFGVFGLIQRYYYEATNYNATGDSLTGGNPFDFQRSVAGVAYRLNKHVTLTADWQNYQFLNASNYRSLASTSTQYLEYGQWMGQTNAFFMQARIAF